MFVGCHPLDGDSQGGPPYRDVATDYIK